MDYLIPIYFIASLSFVIGLKMLSHPATARRGNAVAAIGMAAAIIGTIFLYEDPATDQRLGNYVWIFAALAIGSVIGLVTARRVQMTAMPELVSLFNGMGGACAALISIIEFHHFAASDFTLQIFEGYATEGAGPELFALPLPVGTLITIFLGLIIGSVSFAGSIIAWGKLRGVIKDKAFKGQHIVNLALLATIIVLSVILLNKIQNSFQISTENIINTGDRITFRPGFNIQFTASSFAVFYFILLCSLAYGVLFVLPIGGADMPVVISLLNSFTGVAAACGGFLYDNKVMLTGGILVGAAGTLLTILMCRAMNRSLKNVLIGSFGGSATAGSGADAVGGHYKEISLTDAAVVLSYANKVFIVPGYGLAVAQAQHICHELESTLAEKGVAVKYAIHPVAGRMPGHMNVLLAEADVSYDNLLEMEGANDEFASTDVVLVLGANDVVNPAAKTDPASPIYGMPVLEVEKAKTVIVNKRSMKPGYAGIENALFFSSKTSMLFGDAKKVLQDLVTEIKNT